MQVHRPLQRHIQRWPRTIRQRIRRRRFGRGLRQSIPRQARFVVPNFIRIVRQQRSNGDAISQRSVGPLLVLAGNGNRNIRLKLTRSRPDQHDARTRFPLRQQPEQGRRRFAIGYQENRCPRRGPESEPSVKRRRRRRVSWQVPDIDDTWQRRPRLTRYRKIGRKLLQPKIAQPLTQIPLEGSRQRRIEKPTGHRQNRQPSTGSPDRYSKVSDRFHRTRVHVGFLPCEVGNDFRKPGEVAALRCRVGNTLKRTESLRKSRTPESPLPAGWARSR